VRRDSAIEIGQSVLKQDVTLEERSGMVRKAQRPPVDQADKEKINEFRQELNQKLEDAIEHHEFKMVYIGFATLFAFAGVIYLAVKFPLPFLN
jgi:hypothetical protein